MKIRSKIHTYVMSITALIAMTMSSSCIDESDFVPETCEDICFCAQLDSEITRGTTVNKFTEDTKAGVTGYAGTGSTGNESYSLWPLLDGRTFKFDGDQMDDEDEPIKWKDLPQNTTKVRIYSYIPATTQVTNGQSGLTIDYQVSEDISRQIDLITAYKEVPASNKERIPLNFSHALTAIQFKSGFDGIVKSITVSNVFNRGVYSFETDYWNTSGQTKGSFTINFDEDQDTKGMAVTKGEMITFDSDGTVLLMIPQTFDAQNKANISITYYEGNSTEPKTISTSLTGVSWKAGDMITYTLNEKQDDSQDYIYFDLSAGGINITASKYSGAVYIKNGTEIKKFSGTHNSNNKYYVYQSTEANRSTTGWIGERGSGNCRLPKYDPIMYEGKPWADFITNNTNVRQVIEVWDDGVNITGAAADAGTFKEGNIGIQVVRDAERTHTTNMIKVSGNVTTCDLTIDNIYSIAQDQAPSGRTTAGIWFKPSGNSELIVNFKGDNRFGCIHYCNEDPDNNQLTLQGTGTLTVADADFNVNRASSSSPYGYYSNRHCAAIGNSDNEPDEAYNIVINSGVIFAGTTAAEYATAIGGGGNGSSSVTINGGAVTAVAATTGTAIGGGTGISLAGGQGDVTITNGNIYAYNFKNIHNIPAAAIGGGGSSVKKADNGIVNISGGNVYAYSEYGTAIGGGSSKERQGGDAEIIISGGSVTALSDDGTGIGGGMGGTKKATDDEGNEINTPAFGGSAIINISNNPIIRTGSIGGGSTKNTNGKIGTANITISGGDIQAQFVMAAGAATDPEFIMTDGLIRNSQTNDSEYKHIKSEGGAVYLEAGRFEMSGGEIRNCSADLGGAIYVKGRKSTQGQQNETKFILSGNGKITECISNTSGGAVYLENGSVYLHGGEISGNLANNGNGGGICIVGGNLYMQDASQVDAINNGQNRSIGSTTIKNNAAFGGSGGGVYVSSSTDDVTVNLHQGKIQSNSATRYGGGVCVDMGEVDEDDSNAINVSQGPKAMVEVGIGNVGPEITLNHSTLKGGGLYASGTDANITINAGSIKENTVSGYVDNPNVANEGGMVTLNGDDVTTFVTVTYNNNFEYHGQSGVCTETQKIVTNTNTKMIAPTEWFAQGYLLGYTLSGWNTRPDGKGTPYSTGATMKLSSSITLFAQWTR